MNVMLLSMFNNAVAYLGHYFRQIDALRSCLVAQRDALDLILVEGDSTDDTWHDLKHYMESMYFSGQLWQHHHGQPLRRGTEHPDRLANLSRIWNRMLDAVPENAETVVIVEGDLIWRAEVLTALIERSRQDGNIHCPMVWLGGLFYDTLLYRRNGRQFMNMPPYHPDLVPGQSLELDSAGSCLVMPGTLARTHRTTETHELMGLCHSARAADHKVILDSDLHIEQPSSEWVGMQPFEGAA